MERPSRESDDRVTRGGSEGQIKQSDEHGNRTQGPDYRYASQDLVRGRATDGVLTVVPDFRDRLMLERRQERVPEVSRVADEFSRSSWGFSRAM